MTKDNFETIWKEAVEEGKKRADAHTPTPMNLTDGVNKYHVPEGVCGFAEVVLRDGRSKFAKQGKLHKVFDARYRGVSYWVGEYGQSMELKEKFAEGIVDVLKNKYDIPCFMTSRMD